VGLFSDEIVEGWLEKAEDALTGPELEVTDSHALHGAGAFLGGFTFLRNDEDSEVGFLGGTFLF
jgi:hypothetical protein